MRFSDNFKMKIRMAVSVRMIKKAQDRLLLYYIFRIIVWFVISLTTHTKSYKRAKILKANETKK